MLCADGNSCFLLCNQLLFLLYKLLLLFQQENPAVHYELSCGEKQGKHDGQHPFARYAFKSFHRCSPFHHVVLNVV